MEKPHLATSNTNADGTAPTRPTEIDLSQIITLLHTQYPNFTADSSIKKITFNISEDKETRKRRNAERRARLDFTDEQRREHYAEKLQEYDEEMDDTLTELHEWRAEIMMWKERTPDLSNYAQKRKEIQDALTTLVPRLNPESLFRGGADDTARCGQLLILMEKDWAGTDKEKIAVCHMVSLQWLIRQQAADCAETSSTIHEVKEEARKKKENTTFDEALRKLLIDCLHLDKGMKNTRIGEKDWNKMRLIVALMHVLDFRKTLPTIDEKSYAKLVASIINSDPDNLRKTINRHQQTIKPYGRNLKELSENYIKRNPSDDDKAMSSRDFKEHWDGMYELIDGFIDKLEDLAPLRTKSAQTPSAL